MNLLEREKFLSELNGLFIDVQTKNGFIVAISGEAGIGKTSLVEHFTNQIENQARVLWGTCDDLFTPRPLAPLYDITDQLDTRIVNQLDSGKPRPSIFLTLLKEIQKNEPNIIVIEDAHWADESTLDFIKFFGRRISKCKSLLIITYRDDEIKSEHPLRLALSNLPSNYLKRMKLSSLSENAVNTLALNYGRNDSELYTKTGGNPLLVTELLANELQETPATIKELIASKLNHLSQEVQSAVNIMSVIPGRVEKWILIKLVKDYSLLDQAIEFGILMSEGNAFFFKHELIRMAIEESLSELNRIKYNSLVLNILLSQKRIDHLLSRIIHHAAKAEDSDTILEYAPRAAEQASKLGAHKQASKHYLTAFKYSDNSSDDVKLNLLKGLAYECYLTGQVEEGAKACELILSILIISPDPYLEGKTYRILSRLMWDIGEDKKGEQYLKQSITILEKLPLSKELTMAYSNLSSIYTHRMESELGEQLGKKAIECARYINDLETEVHSLNNIGICKMRDGDDSGEWYLKESLRLSLENNFYEQAARAYCNIGAKYLWRRNLNEATKYLSIGLEYCNEKDFDSIGFCTAGDYAKAKLFAGDWETATDLSNFICSNKLVSNSNRIFPLCVIGQIRARRMDPGALKLLDESNTLALKLGEIDRIVTVKGARAEYYWLQNKINNVVDELETVYEKLTNSNNSWAIGEIAYWLWKADQL